MAYDAYMDEIIKKAHDHVVKAYWEGYINEIVSG